MRELQKQGEDPDNIDEADLEEEVMKEIKRKEEIKKPKVA